MEEERLGNTRESEKLQIQKTSKLKIINTKFSKIKINKLLIFLLLIFFVLLLVFGYLLIASQKYSVSMSNWNKYNDEYLSFEYPANFLIKKYDQETTKAGDECVYILNNNKIAFDNTEGFNLGYPYMQSKRGLPSEVFPNTYIVVNACNFIFPEEGLSLDEKINKLFMADFLVKNGDTRSGPVNAGYIEVDSNIYLSEQANRLTYFVLNDNINAVITVNSSDEKPNKEYQKIAQTIVRNKVPLPTLTPTPTPDYALDWEVQDSDFTSEWKKVVNKKHNYSFEIPKGWVLKYGPGLAIYATKEDIEESDGFTDIAAIGLGSEDLGTGSYARQKIKDTQDMYNRGKQIFSISHAGYSAEMTMLAGENAVNFRICLESCTDSVKLVKNGYIHSIGYSTWGDKEVEVKKKEMRFQVMSHFKFN